MAQARPRCCAGALAQQADVVVENLKVGALMRGTGLDYDSSREPNPRLVYRCSCNAGRAGDP